MEQVVIPAALAASLHERLMRDVREAQALAGALAQAPRFIPADEKATETDNGNSEDA